MDNTPTGRILIVDDDVAIRMALTAMLEDSYEITRADNSVEGLELAANKSFDLVLLDINMPIFDGLDLCKSLKKSEATKDIPVVFITCSTSKEDQMKCFEAGGADFISKPPVKEIVLARVKTHIELKQQRDLILQLQHGDVIPV